MDRPSPFAVSVIICVYNGEKFLERAIQSVLIQKEVAEIILVEDGSTDGTLALCQRFVEEHPGFIRLFQHPGGVNLGLGLSSNLGVHEARYPYVAFLGADDRYLPDRFKRDAELFAADPSLDGVYNALGAEILEKEGEAWWSKSSRRSELTTVRNPPPPERLFFEMNPIGRRGHFSFDAATFRRTVFFEAALFTDLRLSQDTLLSVQLAALCRLAGGETEKPVGMRGIHGQNRIRSESNMVAAKEAVFKELLAWSLRRSLPREKKRALQRLAMRLGGDPRVRRELVQIDPGIRFTRWFYVAILRGWMKRFGELRWLIFRRSPDDLVLPGVFPTFRQRRRRRSPT